MGKAITVRDIPDRTSAALASRAALSGRSLQEYLRQHLIEWAERPDPESWMAEVKLRKQLAPSKYSRQQMLADRDADRR
ncbi:hypothetical protein FDO65_15100 [Nakamurella flava]|jgi:plasmid stability protein|uniref:Antitoxin FitA-like ribbon-helix-helix domain-containing protein n=1 Tax=Nakamurella flava TaxID=2576308 RepID=A0A4U6QFA2_9ACTN|nr:hypothetical protein [Nakamurella flava]TKV58830.1 hypothetical protein FDO65_15100 [Nakamurella flava]